MDVAIEKELFVHVIVDLKIAASVRVFHSSGQCDLEKKYSIYPNGISVSMNLFIKTG